MSKIKSLIEGAHRAVEMRWTVLCYDPQKDNELVESSKLFDCINAAQAHKRELAMKHPGYIIEIVAESKKSKNESIGQEIVDEVKEEIKAELKNAIGKDVDNAIGHPATEENLGAEVRDDMEAEEDELAMEEDIDDDSDSIFAPDDLDEVITESEVDDFKAKSNGAIAIAKAAGFKIDKDKPNAIEGVILTKGTKDIIIGLYDYSILDITAYDKGEDTYSDHWKIDKVSKADIEKATKAAIKSFNESAQKNEAVNAAKVKQDVEKAVKDYFKNDKDALEFVYVDSKKDVHGRTVIEVRAELGYNGMTKLADHLDKVVQKHDRYAYFEQESGGIMTAVFESAQKTEDKEGMNALKKLTKENKFIVYCDGHAKYCKTKQEAEAHAKAIKAGQVKDLLGRTIKPTEPVKIEEIHESVTKANYNEIIKVLSDAIAKAAKKYPEAKLVKKYPAATGSKGVLLEEGLHFTSRDDVDKAYEISEELFKAVKKFEPKRDIGGKLPYMIGNHMASNIINFGLKSQGYNGVSVGYSIERLNLKYLESAQKNESAYISFQECKTLYKLLGKFEKVIAKEYPGSSSDKREYLDEVDSIKTLLEIMWDGEKLESVQINESRNWKVSVELSAPDNMNNAYVEDTVEHFLDKAGLTVFDVTATRK